MASIPGSSTASNVRLVWLTGIILSWSPYLKLVVWVCIIDQQCAHAHFVHRCANVLITNPIWVIVTRMQVGVYSKWFYLLDTADILFPDIPFSVDSYLAAFSCHLQNFCQETCFCERGIQSCSFACLCLPDLFPILVILVRLKIRFNGGLQLLQSVRVLGPYGKLKAGFRLLIL